MKRTLFLFGLFCTFALINADCDSSWGSCIGYPTPCLRNGCWWPAIPRETVEKAVIKALNGFLLDQDFQSASVLFADDPTDPSGQQVCVVIPPFGYNICGHQAIVNYLYLGATDTDTYTIQASNITSLVQEGNTVFADVDQVLHVFFSGADFSPNTVWKFEFNDLHQIQTWTIDVDALAITTHLQPSLNLSAEYICGEIQTWCTGVNQQFANYTQCLAFMEPLRLADPGVLASGDSRTCHAFHMLLAILNLQQDPGQFTPHCRHAGPQVIDPISTPCTDLCQYTGTC